MTDLVGRCFCGKVEYRVTPPFKFCVHDHCTMCRKISGAPFVTWVGVLEKQWVLLKGASELTRFQSSVEANREFCKTCGSHLFFRSSKWPEEVHVTAATLAGDVPDPTAHVYFSDKASWCTCSDDLPKYGGATGMEPL